MGKHEQKKEWVEPEMIVLVRHKSEEAVLAVCKKYDMAGANNVYVGCYGPNPCEQCTAHASS